ncbi:hypothetical protein TNCV_3906611 [Trichonephila clavipes]|nr:hypothetical protein TNCV_3906611 [Trichonephila clavipes]
MCIKLKKDGIPVCPDRRLSCSDNPSPMKGEYRRFVLLEESLKPWQWKRRKKREIVWTFRTLGGKYRCVQLKINLLKRRSYAWKHNVFVEPSGCRRGAFT